MSQVNDILNYLIAIPGRKISTWIAYERFHCTTLAVRIQDIRHKLKAEPLILHGKKYFINDELVTRDGKTFSEYWIEPVKVEVNQTALQFQD